MEAATTIRILVVDDEKPSQLALCDSLTSCGYACEGYFAPVDALTALQQRQFDLLLTDLQMPQMDGVTLMTKALQIDPHLACVLMTGMGTIDSAVRAMQAGALDYVLKPIKLGALLPAISRALDNRRLKLENMELKSTVAIHELTQAIAHTLDPEDLFNKIADAAMSQFDADEASVMLADEDGNSLTIVAVRGSGRELLLGTRIPMGAGIAGRVAEQRNTYVLDATSADTGPQAEFPRHDIQSALSIPMVSRGKLIGVLNVSCLRRRGAFAAGQVKAISVFTNAAAAAIEAARLHEAERKSDIRYREVLDMVADVIVSCDEDMNIIVFNDAAEAAFGYRAADILGQSLDLLLPEALREIHRDHVRNFRDASEAVRPMMSRNRLMARRRNGSLFPIEAGISRRTENGKALFTVVLRDITRRLQQEARIERLTRLYTILSNINATIVRVKDEASLYPEICRIATDKGNYPHAMVVMLGDEDLEIAAASGFTPTIERLPLPQLLPGDDGSLAKTVSTREVTWNNNVHETAYDLGYCRRLALQARSIAYLPFITDNQVHAVMLIYADTTDAFGDEECLLLRELAGDVSFALDHVAKTRHLEFLASYDPLTRLPNRTVFIDRLAQATAIAQERATPMAVMLTDLDRFRLINDSFGRQGGDKLLRLLAERMGLLVPERANLARIGADVFATMHQNFSRPSEVVKVVGRVMDALFTQPFVLDGSPVHVAARTGIAIYPDDGRDADTLLKNAEAALNRAKSQSMRMVLYTADLNARVADRLTLESKLRGALNRREFLLHYQPKVDVVTRQIVGLEALLRWRDPEKGLIPPDRFIGALEEMGLIIEVGTWAMQEAMRAAARLRAQGAEDMRIAVNVSPVQLRDAGFTTTVKEAITLTGKARHGLDLEITESVIMHDIADNVRKLQDIRQLGVDLAIDDFGTGYSSLAYIARLPVGLIKIDRAFIRNLETDNDSIAIVQTIVSLSHALKMKVIAEGVETEGQLQVLADLHCDYYQGYLFSRPVPLDDIEAMLRQLPPTFPPASSWAKR